MDWKIAGTDIERLRQADEEDVIAALQGADFGKWPEDEAGLLEFFNLMIDTILGEEAGEGSIWPNLKGRLVIPSKQ